MNNVAILEDKYLRALLIVCGKAKIKRFLYNNHKHTYHKAIEMACFLVANRITDFGSNDNRRK